MNANSIYLHRKNKVFFKEENLKGVNKLKEEVFINYVGTILKNIESLGYTFDLKLIERLCYLRVKSLVSFYVDLIKDLKEMVGAHVKYEPMYPNFPKQVMEMDEAELYINALLHYFGDWVGLRILPLYKKEEREELIFKDDLKVISLGTEENFKQICSDLLGSNASISETDKQDIKWFVKEYKNDIKSILPDNIPQKETLTYVTSLLLSHKDGVAKLVLKYFSTATDILRLAVAISSENSSLVSNIDFKSFTRKQRKLLLFLLDSVKNPVEDMLRYKYKWIRLGERLHPGEYKDRFVKAYHAFDIIRNNKPYQTFNHKVEKYLKSKNLLKVVDLLKTRPGDFARRLDHLIRLSNHIEIANIFEKLAKDVSTPVLLQILNHFMYRNEEKELRIFFPQNQVAKLYAIPNNLTPINNEIRKKIIITCKNTLIARFKDLEPLGKTFVDLKLKRFMVPFSQRSANKTLVTTTRGSRLKISKGNILRFFIWWNEDNKKDSYDKRVDIDLSAVMYDTDWKYLEHVSYTRLRSANYQATHSGDITSAPYGASEFLDLNIDSILKFGGRYVVMSLNSYTSQPFCDIPECFIGWMNRKSSQVGEIYDPRTVKGKIDISANTKICIPVIIDLLNREVIWTDLALTKNPYWYNNIEGNQKGMVLIGKSFTIIKKMNLYILFMLHTLARGELVGTKEEAETIFSINEGITPFDLEIIGSKFMA